MGQRYSSATIRNIMSRLSELGYLTQPHTSAGRIPTWAGYRSYVKLLLADHRWTSHDVADTGNVPYAIPSTDPSPLRHEQSLDFIPGMPTEHEASTLVRSMSGRLAMLTRFASIAVGPFLRHSILEHMEFIRLRPRTLLAILVTKAGVVHNRTIHFDVDFQAIDLEHLNSYLKSQLGEWTLDELVLRIRSELNQGRAQANSLLQSALLLAEQTLRADTDQTDVFIEGKEHLLQQERFDNIDKIRPILAAMEHRELWLELLERCAGGDVVEIRIGAENWICGLDECTVITVPYGTSRQRLGTLGIIGPMRMDYRTMIPVVVAAAQRLSRRLTAHEIACS